MTSQFWIQLATCFGIGRIPKIPGTIASLAALIFLLDRSGPLLQAVLILTVFFLGVRGSEVVIQKTGKKDPQEVVIDEVCGILMTFFMVQVTWITVTAGFLLFRAFDIIKPPPIRQLEKLPGGWGVMADDAAAGLFANLILQAISYFFLR